RLKPVHETRWLVIRGRYRRPIKYREIRPGSDLRRAMEAERARRTAEEWKDETRRIARAESWATSVMLGVSALKSQRASPNASPYAVRNALEHVVAWIDLDHPNRVATLRIYKDLERYIMGVKKMNRAGAVIVDRIGARGACARLKYGASVAERVCSCHGWSSQCTVTVELKDLENRLRNPGSARSTGRVPRIACRGEDISAVQDIVGAWVRRVRCRELRKGQE